MIYRPNLGIPPVRSEIIAGSICHGEIRRKFDSASAIKEI